MKKKILYLAAVVSVALTSCMNDEFVGDEHALNAAGERPIGFGLDVAYATRANHVGADAATALGNRFIVYGEKGGITNVAPTAGNLVFPNYQVNFAENTAYTTTSNTKNWEYVGYTHSGEYQSNITRKASGEVAAVSASDAAQTIKYWDYAAANYIFTAVSAKDEDITAGRVKIQKNEYGTGPYDKGYTITLAKTTGSPDVYPTLNKLYFSDRQVIEQSAGADRDANNAYGGNVTLTFRNLVSQIRAGIYETIPGYDITAISFYVDNGSGEQTTLAQVSSVNAFGAKCPNISTANYVGALTVTYYESGTVDQPKVTATGTPATNLILGTNISTISDATDNQLGKTASSPTWDKATGDYTEVMPQIENSANMKVKCNYTLWNSVTKETIIVQGATAEVPSQYLQWKPNYKYTYLFKISDDGNGKTNPSLGPAGLYPITFDAIEIVAEDGQAEYITTVSEPSITTFGVKDGKYSIGKNEYETGTDIYATFVAGSTVQAPSLDVADENKANYVQIYKVTTPDATNFPITEASVAEAIANPGRIINAVWSYNGVDTYTPVTDASTLAAGTTYYKSDGTYNPGETGYEPAIAVEGTDYEVAPIIKAANITTDASTNFTAAPSVVTTVPAEDGTTKTINAVKLQGAKTNTYAIEYITYDAGTVLTAEQSKAGYYAESSGVYTVQGDGNGDGSTRYYKQIKTYKVIKVVAAP